MTTRTTICLAVAALALTACGETRNGDSADDSSATTEAPADEVAAAMTDSDKRQAKAQCEVVAVAQGGTAEQAKALCECTVEKVAEGKTPDEFNTVSDEEANSALESCVAETGVTEPA